MKNKSKIKVFSLVVLALLVTSLIYRVTIFNYHKNNTGLPDYAKDKKVVSVWVKESYYADELREKINNYNLNNTDNIYIDYTTVNWDYYNLLRLSLQTKDKPDIFQFGFYDLLKKDEIYNMDELGISLSDIPENNIFYYNGEEVGTKISGTNVKFAWNKEILEKSGLDPNVAPRTWEEVITYATKIKSAFPDVTPFEFPAAGYYDLKISLGEPSVNQGNIYTSFWDYKKGIFDFSYSRNILNIYNKMFDLGLIPEEFNKMDKKAVREDFANKKTAMIISTNEDKGYFTGNLPLSFDIGVSDLPKINEEDPENYYYVQDVNALVANDNPEEREEIKKVYSWLIDTLVDKKLVDTAREINKYPGYEQVEKFKYEEKDPSAVMDFNQRIINDLFHDGIKGTKKVDDVIKGLNNYLDEYCDEVEKIDQNFFENYVDKE
jgi:multiple sugar transport system substrate-binding protein